MTESLVEMWGYWLPTGPDAFDPNHLGPQQIGATWVEVPALPIRRSGLEAPCWVTRPDGNRLWVIDRTPKPEAHGP